MRNYNIWPDDSETISNQKANKRAIQNQQKTFEIIDSIGGLSGNVLDIGRYNHFTELLEDRYKIIIDSTSGDLDIDFDYSYYSYDFVHYNNVIEHQYNQLHTLLKIRDILKDSGYLIFGCPLKPKWITTSECHFHEFDTKAYYELLNRADFKEVKQIRFSYVISVKGMRGLIGSFYRRQVVSLLTKT